MPSRVAPARRRPSSRAAWRRSAKSPEPPRPPIVRAARVGSVTEIAKPILDRALLQQAEAIANCDKDVVTAHDGAQAWRLGTSQVLIAVPCYNAAYNFSSALFFTDADGGKPRPVLLPTAGGEPGETRNLVTNFFPNSTRGVASATAVRRAAGSGPARHSPC